MALHVRFIISSTADEENLTHYMREYPKEQIAHFLPPAWGSTLECRPSVTCINALKKLYREYYTRHNAHMNIYVSRVRTQWQKFQSHYEHFVSTLFGTTVWNKGSYYGYSSIYRVYPKNIRSRMFFFPYKTIRGNKPLQVITHELLHFAFYAYVAKEFGIKTGELSAVREQHLWCVSEAFNTLMEHWKPYQALIKVIESRGPYPQALSAYQRMSRQWEIKQNVKELLHTSLKILM